MVQGSPLESYNSPRAANPTIVLIPGAWHQPVHYGLLMAAFKNYNYDVVTSKMPSVGSSTPKAQSVAVDSAFIKNNLLLPQINAGKDVLLVMHSYGGCPGADAAKGLSKIERKAAGKKGGIIGLVFMCAFVANEGDSLKSKLPGGVYDPWVIWNTQTSQLTVSNPKDVFYNDVNDALAKAAISQILPQSEPALSSPSGPPAWPDAVYNQKRAYIQTLLDHTIPFAAQDAMVTYSGVTWDTIQLNSSHSPFLSHTKEVADYIIGRAKNYVVS
ncbi:alpha/beta-hydrolase [Melanomma pulvis-pyrius CBS 109.77]|uniref:Alpha/beta-hydrolase n=1 Tax=Melanomma pulvis-pyrius CBS 109.77 TaxID=1314802 RepID=A0A6A6X5B5_9PLEO|nr:alpha/beta-hydrolase [Melanomma pulvis-pyrius CBS 109.77]